MATPTAWLMNLDADIELSSPRHYQPTAEMEQRIPGLVTRMATLFAPGDFLLRENGVRSGVVVPTGMRVLAFCPTPNALSRLGAMGLRLSVAAPPLAALRQANGRAFCAQLGQTLPGAAYLYDMESLE